MKTNNTSRAIHILQIALLATVGIALQACQPSDTQEKPLPLVLVHKVGYVQPATSTVYPGTIKGRYESRVSFQVGGRIIARHVQEGTAVIADTVLMELDTKDIAEAVRSSEALIAQLKVQLLIAGKDYARYKELVSVGAVSRTQYEQSLTQQAVIQSSLKQAEAQHVQNLNSLAYATLTAGTDGIITGVHGEKGQVVRAGDTVITLVQTGGLEVELFVPENRINTFQQNQAVTVKSWSSPGQEMKGVVREISPEADALIRSFKVRIALQQPPDDLKLGMSASVTVNADTPLLLGIPASALYQADSSPKVWIVQDGFVHLTPVVVERFDNTTVFIREGLAPDDIIVTTGIYKLSNGQQVRVSTRATGTL